MVSSREDRNKNGGQSAPSGTDNGGGGGDCASLVPLPRLEESLESLNQWSTPVLDNEERAATRAAINNFRTPGGIGQRLQQWLEEANRSAGGHSWMADYLDHRYLGNRQPLVMGDNYFCLFRHEELDGIDRAAALIAATLNFKLVLDQQQKPPLGHVGRGISAFQPWRLFATSRLPGERRDRPGPASPDDASSPRHIIVFHRGNIFSLDLFSSFGIPHSLADITLGLEAIIDKCLGEDQPDGRCPGNLTTMWRPDWAELRERLIKISPLNANDIEHVDRALFCLSLENFAPGHELDACHELQYGEASNRWHDKSLQFIVFSNGMAGGIVERSAIDPPVIMSFTNYILGVDPASLDHYSGAQNQGTPQFRQLNFMLDAQLQQKIARMAGAFRQRRKKIHSRIVEFRDYGAVHLAIWGISPQAIVQIALQLAHYRQYGTFCPSGMEIDMPNHDDARSQTIWCVTMELTEFVETMDDDQFDGRQKWEYLKRAVKSIEKRMDECARGHAPLQHLKEMRYLHLMDPGRFEDDFLARLKGGEGLSAAQIEKGMQLFSTPGWKCLQERGLRGSIVQSEHIVFQGFGPPPGEHGSYGCVVAANYINCHLSIASQAESAEDELDELARGWHKALSALGELVQKSSLPLRME